MLRKKEQRTKRRQRLSAIGGILLLVAVTAALIVAIRFWNASVIFYDSEGKLLQKVDSRTCDALSLKNEEGFTFLGWSRQPGTQTNPEFRVGDTIRVWQTTRLYPVMFDWSREDDITPEELPVLNTDKYSRVIFVGDSRCVKMRKTFEKQGMMSKLEHVSFVCKSGRGLDWFRQEGVREMMRGIHEARQTSGKPVAVVFNLGINDLRHALDKTRRYEIAAPDCRAVSGEYISYMNDLAKTLKESECRLFYMTINPLNSRMADGRRIFRKEEDVWEFNRYMKEGLDDRYGYIDTCELLAQTGYSTNNDVGNRKDDGIHYSMRTYKRIYAYALMCINMAD